MFKSYNMHLRYSFIILSSKPNFKTFSWYYFQVAAYDTVEKKMAFFDPSRAKDFLFISGTKVRRCPYNFLWCVERFNSQTTTFSNRNIIKMFLFLQKLEN